jgi:hypothetical protein
MGFSGVAIAATTFWISELPKYTVLKIVAGSENVSGYEPHIYGVAQWWH